MFCHGRVFTKHLPAETGEKGEIIFIPISHPRKDHPLRIDIKRSLQLKDGHRPPLLNMNQHSVRENFPHLHILNPGMGFPPPGDLLQREGKEIGHSVDPCEREDRLLRYFPAPPDPHILHLEKGVLQKADIQLMAREAENSEEKDKKGHPYGSFENFLKPLTSPFFPF